MARLSAVVAAVLLLASVALVRPPSTAAASCSGGGKYFDGNIQAVSPHPYGVAATIQAYNPVLCTGGLATLSASWVALQGVDGPQHYNILQIGTNKCAAGGCVAGAPASQLYYFWAYGREAGGPCGVAVPPFPTDDLGHSIGNAAVQD